jgi:hypothetical protein
VAARNEITNGVEYLQLTRNAPDEVAHVAHIAPGAPVDLRVVNASNKLPTGPGDLETTSSMCRRAHCAVGVNGDFHINGVPQGGVVTSGRMLHSPDPGLPQLTVTRDGQLVAGPLAWTGSFTFADNTPMPVATINADPPAGALALFTPEFGGDTPPSNRTELVVRTVHGSLGMLNQPADVELRAVRSGAGPIPDDGAVLSADGDAAQKLLTAWGRKANGAGSRGRLSVGSPVNAAESIGAYPVVLKDGKRATPWRDPNLVNPRQPHTLVGWNDAGDVYLVAVDGRQDRAEGLTMAEAADFLVGLGVTDAVNLDGGGGTTFVTDGSVVNRPSDSDPTRPAQYVERGAANAFVVIARPAAPAPIRPMAVPADDTPPPTAPKSSGDAAPDLASPSMPSDPDNGAGFYPGPAAGGVPAAGDQIVGLPVGADPGAAASALKHGGTPLTPSPQSGAEETPAIPSTSTERGADNAHKTTEALRAPLGAAESLTTDVVDAVLGEQPGGPASPLRRTAAALTAALALTATVIRRNRRSGNRLPAAAPAPVLPPPPTLGPPAVEAPAPEAPTIEAPAIDAPAPVFFVEVPSRAQLIITVPPRPRPVSEFALEDRRRTEPARAGAAQ